MGLNIEYDEYALLLHWINEREGVRVRRASGNPKPWTQDAIIRDHRWCNVRRMDDKVSKWLMETWYPSILSRGWDPVACAVLARLVNWPEALAGVFELCNARGHLSARAARGEKVFTGAYIVPGTAGRSKVNSVCDIVEAVEEDADVWGLSMKSTWRRLREFPGLGGFLAGQVVADLAHLNTGLNWSDRATWAPLGPGSKRGVNRLLGRHKEAFMSQPEFETYIGPISDAIREHAPGIWHDRGLTAMDVQNCLCEYDKYRRLQLGEGQVRAKYPGLPERGGMWS